MEELIGKAFQVEPEPFWEIAQMMGDDGYDRIGRAAKHDWEAISAWGAAGWDLGDWPYVVISFRDRGNGFELAYNVEGDITVYRYASAADRERATDILAFFHWKAKGNQWVEGIESAAGCPPELRGAYHHGRSN